MPESYENSALRHRSDAKHLAEDARFLNAGHLIGFAAECLVKSILKGGGITVDKRSGLKVHFPNLRSGVLVSGHSRLMGALLPVLNQSDFLQFWDVELRYEQDMPTSDAKARWQKWVADVDSLFSAAGMP